MADEVSVAAAEPTGVVEQPAEDTGANGEQSPPQQPTDWAVRLKEDPDLAEFVRKEADRLRQKERDRERRAELKRLAQEASAATDETTRNQRAQELASRVATEEDPEDRDNASFITKARQAEAAIARLRQYDEYAEIYRTHGKAEMDRRWHQDPEEYADWVWEQITDLRAEKRARAKAGPMAEATAQDIANQRLRNLPTPVTGAGGASVGGMTLDRLLGLSHAERTAWKAQHKTEYDQLVQALATAG